MVASAAEYAWSSAAAHLTGLDTTGLLDMQWWQKKGRRTGVKCWRLKMLRQYSNCGNLPIPADHSERKASWLRLVRRLVGLGCGDDLRRTIQRPCLQSIQQINSVYFEDEAEKRKIGQIRLSPISPRFPDFPSPISPRFPIRARTGFSSA